jgi:hypothetical protein
MFPSYLQVFMFPPFRNYTAIREPGEGLCLADNGCYYKIHADGILQGSSICCGHPRQMHVNAVDVSARQHGLLQEITLPRIFRVSHGKGHERRS